MNFCPIQHQLDAGANINRRFGFGFPYWFEDFLYQHQIDSRDR
jgi:hypothetical protein